MKLPYPNARSALEGALNFPHALAEIKSVRYLLRPHAKRTPASLTAFGRAFAKRFVPSPTRIQFVPGAPDQFNHTKRIIQIGKPELVRLLHEIGHAKYGPSEASAVAYSLGLILKALPEFVPVLEGHVLANDPY